MKITIIFIFSSLLLTAVQSKIYKNYAQKVPIKEQDAKQEDGLSDLDYDGAENLFKNSNIVHRHDFNYILNPGELVCGRNKGADIFLLIYAHSAPSYYKRRQAIRETWGQINRLKSVKLVFMLGYNPDANTTSLLKYENSLYGDIIQEDFYDAYRNLTHKAIMALKWINNYCSNVTYVLKSDDDIIVNIFNLLNHLKTLDKHKIIKKPTIMCFKYSYSEVIRDTENKWYVSRYEYRGNKYGKYCSGSAFVITSDSVLRMYNASKYIRYFWVDDYYITGMVARAANISYYAMNSLYTIFESNKAILFSGKKSSNVIFGHIPEKLDNMYRIWSYIFADFSYNFITNQNTQHLKDLRILDEFNWLL